MKQSLKTCTGCNVAKPRSEFHKNNGKKSNRDGLNPKCKVCNCLVKKLARQNPTTRGAILASSKRSKAKHYVQFRIDIDNIKDVPCMDCGKRFPPGVMDFDHRDSKDKSFDIGEAVGRSWSSVLAEIAKADIICCNCHRIRGHNRRELARGDKPLGRGAIERRDVIWPLKSQPCSNCGETFHPIAMDFDHIDSDDKLFDISHYQDHYSIKHIATEVEKCVLLCGNCHRIKTHANRETMNRKKANG